MPILYTYFRSSCSYRVRIALNLKQLACEYRYVNIHPDVSEQRTEDYLGLNPQGRVPCLIDDDVRLTQSPAILEYLEEKYPQTPLLPRNTTDRARVRQLVNIIACDIQPLNNLSVLNYLKKPLESTQDQVSAWYRHWIRQGFVALESLLKDNESQFCIADEPSLADVYLVPQVWNAYRFDVPMDDFPTIKKIDAACRKSDAFRQASPEVQRDYPDAGA